MGGGKRARARGKRGSRRSRRRRKGDRIEEIEVIAHRLLVDYFVGQLESSGGEDFLLLSAIVSVCD